MSHHAIAASLGLTICLPQNVRMLKALCSRHYQRKAGGWSALWKALAAQFAQIPQEHEALTVWSTVICSHAGMPGTHHRRLAVSLTASEVCQAVSEGQRRRCCTTAVAAGNACRELTSTVCWPAEEPAPHVEAMWQELTPPQSAARLCKHVSVELSHTLQLLSPACHLPLRHDTELHTRATALHNALDYLMVARHMSWLCSMQSSCIGMVS